MSRLKKINEYYSVGQLQIGLTLLLCFLLILLYFGKYEIAFTDLKKLTEIFTTIAGLLLGFFYRGSLNIGMEFNDIVGLHSKSEFLMRQWDAIKNDLKKMYLSFSSLLFILILTHLGIYKENFIMSNSLLFLIIFTTFVGFIFSYGGCVTRQYLSLRLLSKHFSPTQDNDIEKI